MGWGENLDRDSLLSVVQDARTMSVCQQWIEPLLKKQELSIVDSLKAHFRVGKYTEQSLACHIAQLTAIDDLRNQMTGVSRAGEIAQQEMENFDPDKGL